MKYYVKAPISGWHEVTREQLESFVNHIRNNSNPPDMTKDELIKRLTKIVK